MTDESRIVVLRQELDEAIRKRQQLDVVIGYLQTQLGEDPGEIPSFQSARPARQSGAGEPGKHPSALVNPGEFYGKTSTTAARAVLDRIGRTRPLTTGELFEAIKKGGVDIQDQQVLYRSLFRSTQFLKVAKSTWGLAAWYPDSKVKAAREKAALEGSGDEPTNDLEGSNGGGDE